MRMGNKIFFEHGIQLIPVITGAIEKRREVIQRTVNRSQRQSYKTRQNIDFQKLTYSQNYPNSPIKKGKRGRSTVTIYLDIYRTSSCISHKHINKWQRVC